MNDEVQATRERSLQRDGLVGINGKRASKVGEDAAQRLAKHIVSNNIPPGTSLPPEKEMAETFGIGRVTMREALRMLETFGLLQIRTGRYGGPVVRRPDAEDLSSSLRLAFYANGSSMLDVLDARMVMEPAMAELAAQRITTEDLELLRKNILEMREADQQDFLVQAERFHNIVARAAMSPVLSHLCAGLQKIAGGESVGITYAPTQRLATAAAHEAIVTALAAGDGHMASKLWRDHLLEAGEYWRRRFPENARQAVEWRISRATQL